VYELSELAEEFLRAQFLAYDVDGDGMLTWQQLDAMWYTIPPPMWQVKETVLCTYGVIQKWHRK
jgi:hypothetical protein